MRLLRRMRADAALLRWLPAILMTWAVAAAAEWTPGTRLKLVTRQGGLHRLTAASAASAMNLPEAGVRDLMRERSLDLSHRDGPVDFDTELDGSALIFYAPLHRNNYTDDNVFWLTPTNPPRAPLPARDGGSPAAVTGLTWTASVSVQQDVLARYETGTHPDSNYWFWAEVVASHRVRGRFSDVVTLDAVQPGGALARLRLRVMGRTETNHLVTLAVNGVTNAGWQAGWFGRTAQELAFDFPATHLRSGANTNLFTALGQTVSQWWIDGYTLEYPRSYEVKQGALDCLAAAHDAVTLTGFTSSGMRAFEVLPPSGLVRVTNLNVELQGSWRASLRPSAAESRLVVWQQDAALPAPTVQAVPSLGLLEPTNQAALVIVAHTALVAAAETLAAYRRTQGLSARVVPLDAVFDECNGGLREPEAIRAFLRAAQSRWAQAPAYLLFAGNGSYDYRNRLGLGDNLVPPLMVPTHYGLAASDSEFGNLSGGPGPELAVGRLPAVNAAQLTAMIAKLVDYEARPARHPQPALLIADSPDVAGDFVSDLAQVAGVLDGRFNPVSVLPDSVDTMRWLIQSNLHAGTDLVCYLGHGASDRFGTAGYLTTADVASLSNCTVLPLITGMTCLAGIFAEPGYTCLSEALTLATNGGAIAVLAPTGLSINEEAVALNLELMSVLAQRRPGRLGDFVVEAMQRYNETPMRFTPSAIYGILGDPSLVFRGTGVEEPARITGTRWTAAGLELTFVATPGASFAIWSAPELEGAPWTLRHSGTAPAASFTWTDSEAIGAARGFYRAGQEHP